MNMSKGILFFLCMPLLFMAFCNSNGRTVSADSNGKSDNTQWKVLLSGQGSGIVNDTQLICTSGSEFEKIWITAFTDYPGQYSKPEVDFNENFVICCFQGNVRSAGYAVKVKNVQKNANGLEITIEYTEPGQGCINASVIETPFTIISVAGMVSNSIKYSKEKNITKCE
ncbi:MAG TPA: protease complex subunit PrcB family protein [Chitinophagaceae bacterium]|nr:protease complex subunit PrcB family protein [Chitinophagaceae bacterium]